MDQGGGGVPCSSTSVGERRTWTWCSRVAPKPSPLNRSRGETCIVSLDWGPLRNFTHQIHLATQETDPPRAAGPLPREPGPDSRLPGCGIVRVGQSQRGQCGKQPHCRLASPVPVLPLRDPQPRAPAGPEPWFSAHARSIPSPHPTHSTAVPGIYHLTDAAKMPLSCTRSADICREEAAVQRRLISQLLSKYFSSGGGGGSSRIQAVPLPGPRLLPGIRLLGRRHVLSWFRTFLLLWL